MPISLTDDNGDELDLDKADGGTLRRKLEEALQRNKELAQELVTSKAEKAIGEHGKGLVKPEDLKGVSPDQVEARVKELAEQRLSQRREVIREVLASRDGLEGDDLEAAVDDFLGGGSESQFPVRNEPGLDDLAGLAGERPARTQDLPPLTDPFGNLESHFAEEARRGRK